jgi:hypothetical protein
MRRRDFIAGLVVQSGSMAARGARAGATPRVGLLHVGPPPSFIEPLRQGLKELGRR